MSSRKDSTSERDPLVGTVKGPGERPHEFLFITADNLRARIGEFVYYSVRDEEDERRILGNVTARRLVRNLPDAFLSDPETSPAVVSALIGLDGEGCELYEITVETIGYFSRRLNDFVNPRIPPGAGDPVFLASSETLASVLSSKRVGDVGSAHVGSLLTREAGAVPVVLSVKDVVSTHLAILASTGSGKSYTAGVLVEELMMPHNRASVLIVDPHGEYGTLTSIESDPRFAAGKYQPEVKVFTPERIRVRFSSLTEADIKYLLPEGTSDKMLHYLSQAYRKLRASARGENETYAYHDLRDAVTSEKYGDEDGKGGSGNAGSIDALLWRLDSRFDNTGRPDALFHDREHIPLQDIFMPGRCTVLQLSDIEQNEQQVIVATLLRRVNKARMMTVRGESSQGENHLPYPVFTLIEEAHRFAPAGATVVSTNILKQILSEGRKFGVGIGLITQRPGKLDQDVLSQCMTQVIMRIVNPVDQDTVAKSVEGAGRQLLQELPALTKGQAVISGVGVNTPVMCRVRERITRHGGETFDAPSEWADWHADDARERRAQDEAVMVKPSAKKVEKFRGIEL